MRYNEAFRFLMGAITVLVFPIEKLRIKVCSMRNDKLSDPYPSWPENEWQRINALLNPILAEAYLSVPFLLVDEDGNKLIDLECMYLHVNMDGTMGFDKATNLVWTRFISETVSNTMMSVTTKTMKKVKAQGALLKSLHADVIWTKINELLLDPTVDKDDKGEDLKLTRGERRIKALMAKPKPKAKAKKEEPTPPKGDWDGLADI